MKKLILLAGIAALAACTGKEPAAEETATAEAPAAAVAAAPAVGPTPGSYDVTGPDGTKLVATLMADGTYVDRDDPRDRSRADLVGFALAGQDHRSGTVGDRAAGGGGDRAVLGEGGLEPGDLVGTALAGI